MPKRCRAGQLDRAIEAMLIAPQPGPEPNPSPALAQLMTTARALRNLPRSDFKSALRPELQSAAFGAEALGVHKSPEGHVLHATLSIGNSTFEIE
jgi:hypothetical protein